MAATPEMRASDGDRDRVAAALREHVAEGRLSVEEFNERLEQLYRSRTYGELATLTADLPEIDLHRLPAAAAAESDRPLPARRDDKARTALKAAWAGWAGITAVNWMVWLTIGVTSGHFVYPWPLWVMGPWGTVLLAGTLIGVAAKPRRRR
ncbi:DUF1707 SHOCT-like domain-containing protein [Microbispora triticiradicis]|uniref:DUF1707 SHOCT-like domain-containing protein n=1 Tax=Microbispora triticiradicis TaxID=2200763 RepID=UPI001AD739FC|nr:DUF1707 domain-containing protein [Microbispora triticiradicis]MBO4271146.1 DUF1707 domain-containing protein [Microbispora triticiradicis]